MSADATSTKRPYTATAFIISRLIVFIWMTICLSAILIGLHSGYWVGGVELGSKDPFNTNSGRSTYSTQRAPFTYFIFRGRVGYVNTTNMAYRADLPHGVKRLLGIVAVHYNGNGAGQSWDWDNKQWALLMMVGVSLWSLMLRWMGRSRTVTRWQEIADVCLGLYCMTCFVCIFFICFI